MKLLRKASLVLVVCGLLALAAPDVLAQRITIEGAVMTEDGTPVVGAQVVAMTAKSTKPVGKGKTKKNGNFRFAFFPTAAEATYRFKAEKDGLLMGGIAIQLLMPDRSVGAAYDEPIGPHQELHEFSLRANSTAVIELKMVPAEKYAGAFSIPGDPESSKRLGEANRLSGEGKVAESNTILEALVAEGIENANVFYLLGRNAIALKQMDDMVRWFDKTLELNPDQAGVHGQLAMVAYERGEKEKALDHYTREAALSPGQTAVAVNRATLLAELERDEEAVQAFEAVLERSPGEVAVYPELASLYFKLGQDERGAELLERLDEAGQGDAPMWFRIGARFSNRGRLEQAEMAYRKCLAIDAVNADAIRELGFLEIRKGNKPEALEHLRRYLELKPDGADAEQIRRLEASLSQTLQQP